MQIVVPLVDLSKVHRELKRGVLDGVRIGKGAVVGGGAAVTGEIALGEVVAGSAARLLRRG